MWMLKVSSTDNEKDKLIACQITLNMQEAIGII